MSATREVGPGGDETVALRYQVRRGPLTRLATTGFALSAAVIADMKAAWSRSVDDRFLQEDLRERARVAMGDLGYLWAKIDSEVHATDEPREKSIDVKIVPGARAGARVVAFRGNHAVTERELQQEIDRTDLGAKLWREPDTVAGVLKEFYRRKGFLAARVSAAPAVLDGATARLPITIDEGLRHVVSRIDVRGPGEIAPGQVETWISMRVGEPFNPAEAPLSARRIEAGYVEAGYRSARAEVTAAVEPGTGRVTVVAQVHPGVRSVIRDVTVTGRIETRESVVARSLRLPAGTPASPSRIDRAQRRLYETEAFKSVDISLEPIAQVAESAAEQPIRAVVTLEEAPLYRLRYGVQLTDDLSPEIQARELRPGVAAEIRRRNLFGSAFSVALGGRYERNSYSIRGALNIPRSVIWPAISTLFVKQSVQTYQEPTFFRTAETSVTYQDRWRLGRRTELSYGYAFIREAAPFAGIVAPAATGGGPTSRANLFAAVARDSRDSVFNATNGWFHSSSVEYGSPTLGSDFSYLRVLLQQTLYRKTGPVVLAGAARVGILVHVTGDESQSFPLRFRTGGDRTIRGYAEESISPPGVEAGGRALLVLNGEIRFPVWRWLKGVAFLDAGNAFVDPAHLSLRDLKVGSGLGIRLDTPYALFRFDVGFPIPQTSNRLIGRWYFSIGQSF